MTSRIIPPRGAAHYDGLLHRAFLADAKTAALAIRGRKQARAWAEARRQDMQHAVRQMRGASA